MKTLLLAGAAALALLPANVRAQTSPSNLGPPDAQTEQPHEPNAPQSPAPGAVPSAGATAGSGLDTTVPLEGDAAAPAPPAPTGNAILDRLNALEAKVQALEARNHELEDQAAATQDRVQKVEVRAAKGVQPGVAPTFADSTGEIFTFKPRGMLQIDYAGFNERKGGYDYNNGTLIRRGRFGFDGTFYRRFKYRIEAEYVGNTVNLLDAYLSYNLSPRLLLTVGQQKAPYGLEANSSDAFNEFLERGMANNAFGAVGAERRVGATIAYLTDRLTATLGVFGAGEAVGRNATTPDETYGVNGRVTFEPVNEPGKVLHVGASAYHVTDFAANSVTVGDRPGVRVDGGLLVSAAIAGTAPVGKPQTGVKDGNFYGFEGAGVLGPFSVQGEYDHLTLTRFGGLKDVNFDGFYVFGSVFLTGESRAFKNGVIDRLKPRNDFDPTKGHWGAFELAARYDRLDLTDLALSPLARRGQSFTGALNWYLSGNVKLLFNYIRFSGQNSPLVAAPVALNGTTAKGDAFATRLHLDF